MNDDRLKQLFKIIQRKHRIDRDVGWDSQTYLNEISKELKEVQDEIKSEKQIYLEDELGDVLWDYCNALYNLEKEGKIRAEKVFENVLKKYDERISGLELQIPWKTIKEKQKVELERKQQEFENLNKKKN